MDAASDSSAVMHCGVASIAQSDQVLLQIVPGMTAKLFVMDFKVGHRAAELTPPTVDVTPDCAAPRTIRDRAAGVHVSDGLESRRLLSNVVHKFLPLFAGEQLEKA